MHRLIDKFDDACFSYQSSNHLKSAKGIFSHEMGSLGHLDLFSDGNTKGINIKGLLKNNIYPLIFFKIVNLFYNSQNQVLNVSIQMMNFISDKLIIIWIKKMLYVHMFKLAHFMIGIAASTSQGNLQEIQN